MESQKIINFIEDADNEFLTMTMDSVEKEMEIILLLNLIQKLLNQTCVIILIHTFL